MLLTRADNGRDTKATAAPAAARDHAAAADLASRSANHIQITKLVGNTVFSS